MIRRGIAAAGGIFFLAALLLLSGCAEKADYESYEKAAGQLSWLMAPNRDYYLIKDGDEPADSYYCLEYSDSAKAYYITYPFERNRYITPKGEELSMMEDYAYLAELPLVQEDKDGTDYYAYADGTRAFKGNFFAASDFEGEYAHAFDLDWHGVVLDKTGRVIYRTESDKSALYYGEGSIFVEIKDHESRFIDVRTGETIHSQFNCDTFTKIRGGWVLRNDKEEKFFLVNEQFEPLWDGRLFDSIDGYIGKNGESIYATDSNGQITYRDENGEEILKLKKGERGLWGDGKILVYTGSRLECYFDTGKKIFSKEMSKEVKPEELWDVEGFCDGVAVVTLDGEKYGVIDEKGSLLTPCVFEYARVCSNHTIMAAYDRKGGILAF